MGKKDKEHRAKVAKRNKRINQEKSGMQKAFDKLDQLEVSDVKKKTLRVFGESLMKRSV